MNSRDSVNSRDLREARDDFRRLLKLGGTEPQWQSLLAKHPYIFSSSLPIQISPEEVVPLGRPGRSEADFVFYPTNIECKYPTYGVIELKRPDSKVLITPRRNIVTLSSDATTAAAQANRYGTDLRNELEQRRGSSIAFGNHAHLFLIMGLSERVAQKLTNDIEQRIIDELLPKHLRLIPYDTLLSMFEEQVPNLIVSALPLWKECSTNESIDVTQSSEDQELGTPLDELVQRLREQAEHLELTAQVIHEDLSMFEISSEEDAKMFERISADVYRTEEQAIEYHAKADELESQRKLQ